MSEPVIAIEISGQVISFAQESLVLAVITALLGAMLGWLITYMLQQKRMTRMQTRLRTGNRMLLHITISNLNKSYSQQYVPDS